MFILDTCLHAITLDFSISCLLRYITYEVDAYTYFYLSPSHIDHIDTHDSHILISRPYPLYCTDQI